MPIKKHILEAHKINGGCVVEIPQSVCDAIGIQNGTPVKLYSNNNGYSFTVEVVPSYENVKALDVANTKNTELRNKNVELEKTVQNLKQRVFELENNL